MVDKLGQKLYQSRGRTTETEIVRLGYAAQGTDYQFSGEISGGLQRTAAAEGIELICIDNRYSAKLARRGPDLLVREKRSRD